MIPWMASKSALSDKIQGFLLRESLLLSTPLVLKALLPRTGLTTAGLILQLGLSLAWLDQVIIGNLLCFENACINLNKTNMNMNYQTTHYQ